MTLVSFGTINSNLLKQQRITRIYLQQPVGLKILFLIGNNYQHLNNPNHEDFKKVFSFIEGVRFA